jgi:hypothetical protein
MASMPQLRRNSAFRCDAVCFTLASALCQPLGSPSANHRRLGDRRLPGLIQLGEKFSSSRRCHFRVRVADASYRDKPPVEFHVRRFGNPSRGLKVVYPACESC